jgi:hypothetical protein
VGLDGFLLGSGQVAGFCEHGNELIFIGPCIMLIVE